MCLLQFVYKFSLIQILPLQKGIKYQSLALTCLADCVHVPLAPPSALTAWSVVLELWLPLFYPKREERKNTKPPQYGELSLSQMLVC